LTLASNSILFGKPPHKAQNNEKLYKFGGHGPLAMPMNRPSNHTTLKESFQHLNILCLPNLYTF